MSFYINSELASFWDRGNLTVKVSDHKLCNYCGINKYFWLIFLVGILLSGGPVNSALADDNTAIDTTGTSNRVLTPLNLFPLAFSGDYSNAGDSMPVKYLTHKSVDGNGDKHPSEDLSKDTEFWITYSKDFNAWAKEKVAKTTANPNGVNPNGGHYNGSLDNTDSKILQQDDILETASQTDPQYMILKQYWDSDNTTLSEDIPKKGDNSGINVEGDYMAVDTTHQGNMLTPMYAMNHFIQKSNLKPLSERPSGLEQASKPYSPVSSDGTPTTESDYKGNSIHVQGRVQLLITPNDDYLNKIDYSNKSNQVNKDLENGNFGLMVKVILPEGFDASQLDKMAQWNLSQFFLQLQPNYLYPLGSIVPYLGIPLIFEHKVYTDPKNKNVGYLKVIGAPYRLDNSTHQILSGTQANSFSGKTIQDFYGGKDNSGNYKDPAKQQLEIKKQPTGYFYQNDFMNNTGANQEITNGGDWGNNAATIANYLTTLAFSQGEQPFTARSFCDISLYLDFSKYGGNYDDVSPNKSLTKGHLPPVNFNKSVNGAPYSGYDIGVSLVGPQDLVDTGTSSVNNTNIFSKSDGSSPDIDTPMSRAKIKSNYYNPDGSINEAAMHKPTTPISSFKPSSDNTTATVHNSVGTWGSYMSPWDNFNNLNIDNTLVNNIAWERVFKKSSGGFDEVDDALPTIKGDKQYNDRMVGLNTFRDGVLTTGTGKSGVDGVNLIPISRFARLVSYKNGPQQTTAGVGPNNDTIPEIPLQGGDSATQQDLYKFMFGTDDYTQNYKVYLSKNQDDPTDYEVQDPTPGAITNPNADTDITSQMADPTDSSSTISGKQTLSAIQGKWLRVHITGQFADASGKATANTQVYRGTDLYVKQNGDYPTLTIDAEGTTVKKSDLEAGKQSLTGRWSQILAADGQVSAIVDPNNSETSDPNAQENAAKLYEMGDPTNTTWNNKWTNLTSKDANSTQYNEFSTNINYDATVNPTDGSVNTKLSLNQNKNVTEVGPHWVYFRVLTHQTINDVSFPSWRVVAVKVNVVNDDFAYTPVLSKSFIINGGSQATTASMADGDKITVQGVIDNTNANTSDLKGNLVINGSLPTDNQVLGDDPTSGNYKFTPDTGSFKISGVDASGNALTVDASGLSVDTNGNTTFTINATSSQVSFPKGAKIKYSYDITANKADFGSSFHIPDTAIGLSDVLTYLDASQNQYTANSNLIYVLPAPNYMLTLVHIPNLSFGNRDAKKAADADSNVSYTLNDTKDNGQTDDPDYVNRNIQVQDGRAKIDTWGLSAQLTTFRDNQGNTILGDGDAQLVYDFAKNNAEVAMVTGQAAQPLMGVKNNNGTLNVYYGDLTNSYGTVTTNRNYGTNLSAIKLKIKSSKMPLIQQAASSSKGDYQLSATMSYSLTNSLE